MKRFVLPFALSVMILIAVWPQSRAQNVSVIPLVPAANWRLVTSQALGVDEIQKYGGDPAVEREYGVKSVELRTYQLDRVRTVVILETAADVSAAYGLFTYYQNESMHPEKAIQLAVTGPQDSLMARGRSFIHFLHAKDSQPSENEYRALMIFVGGIQASSYSLTNLPPPLPSSGLIAGSEKYILGPEVVRRILPNFPADSIGFNQGAEVQVGEYHVDNSRATMMEVSYPTPQIARIRFDAMNNLLGINEDRGANTLYGRRETSFIFLALKAKNKAAATELLDHFKVTEEVNWDEKYPGNKTIGMQLFELFMGNALLTLLLAGGGIAGGVLIVLSRRVTARWFPASEWGHPEANHLIRLNL